MVLYDRQFFKIVCYAPEHIERDLKKPKQFWSGLRTEIHVQIVGQGRLTYKEMLMRAIEIEASLRKDKSIVVPSRQPPQR